MYYVFRFDWLSLALLCFVPSGLSVSQIIVLISDPFPNVTFPLLLQISGPPRPHVRHRLLPPPPVRLSHPDDDQQPHQGRAGVHQHQPPRLHRRQPSSRPAHGAHEPRDHGGSAGRGGAASSSEQEQGRRRRGSRRGRLRVVEGRGQRGRQGRAHGIHLWRQEGREKGQDEHGRTLESQQHGEH